MTSTAHETLHLRPPTPSHSADVSWASLSPTVRPRHVIFPVTVDGPEDGISHDDPYVRIYWVAAIGAPAVTDLLRISRAARHGAGLRRPIHLATLLAERVIAWRDDQLIVPDPLPRLGPIQRERLRRTRHRQLLT